MSPSEIDRRCAIRYEEVIALAALPIGTESLEGFRVFEKVRSRCDVLLCNPDGGEIQLYFEPMPEDEGVYVLTDESKENTMHANALLKLVN
jgi:hypothetical protein